VSRGAPATTHVDAPRHFLPDGATIDQLPLSAFIGTGVVLDARGAGPVIRAGFLRSARPAIQPGDVVFLYTGHAARFGTPDYVDDHPHLADDAAQLLVELGARMVGMDVPTPDLALGSRDAGFAYPVHTALIAGGVLIVENLGPGLAEVLGERLILGIMPLAIVGADGGPGTAFALRSSTVGTAKEQA
jgi:kynurenine formamidase